MAGNDQLQIGDDVIYLPDNVITKVDGYEWCEQIGEYPRIVAYKLSCGISAQRSVLNKIVRKTVSVGSYSL